MGELQSHRPDYGAHVSHSWKVGCAGTARQWRAYCGADSRCKTRSARPRESLVSHRPDRSGPRGNTRIPFVACGRRAGRGDWKVISDLRAKTNQNNSFDEFRKRGYAPPNHGRCVRSETARVWALFVLVQHIQESKETRSET